VTEWFDLGGTLQIDDTLSSSDLLARTDSVQGLHEAARSICAAKKPSQPSLASAVDFVLEGLYAQRKISRSVEGHFQAGEQPKRAPRNVDQLAERDVPLRNDKKKYYN
jgi:magnesium chelatase subunit I